MAERPSFPVYMAGCATGLAAVGLVALLLIPNTVTAGLAIIWAGWAISMWVYVVLRKRRITGWIRWSVASAILIGGVVVSLFAAQAVVRALTS